MKNKIKLLITIAIIIAFVWFLVVSPLLVFKGNEKKLEEAAREYYELNSTQLPTGERVATVDMKTLFHKSFLKEDLLAPYTNKSCSIENSWVKVKRENGEYKYYTYLECGVMKSAIDSKGPEIKLNGSTSMSIGVGEKFEDPGVKSVVDNNDGKLKVEDVTIKGNVDTSKIGTYEISYTAFDSLNNKTTIIREVSVVKSIKSVVKKDLGSATNYTGEPTNNYIRLSNMIFQIYGINNDGNIIIVADQDIANVNYSKIDDWLEYYYDHLNEKTKKMIVKSKYCNMTVTDTTLDTTECSAYTKKKNVYIPSIVEVNRAQAGEDNFMKPSTMSWVANSKNSKEAYLTRKLFFYEEEGKNYLAYSVTDNYGVRPMMVIDGESLIKDGSGTVTDPYVFGDTQKAKNAALVNTRYTGEYISIGDILWRIVDVEKDGTTKVISLSTIGDFESDSSDGYLSFYSDSSTDKITYDPSNKRSIGYIINNKASTYIDTKYFVNHNIEVPIYKKNIIYGEEVDIKKYKVKLSAPNMYEMFSAKSYGALDTTSTSYWLLNTSQTSEIGAAISVIGVPLSNIKVYDSYGVRVVAYIKDDATISSGNGTQNSPYILM